MKNFFLNILFAAGLFFSSQAQNYKTDSLKQLLNKQSADSNRFNILIALGSTYYFTKPDSCLLYTQEALTLARNLHFNTGIIKALNYCGEPLRFLGDYPGALKMQMEALEMSRKIKDTDSEAGSLGFIGLTYVEFKEYKLGLQYLFQSLVLNKKLNNRLKETFDLTNIGNAYDMLNVTDSALYYQRLALTTYQDLKHGPLKSLILGRYGNAFASRGELDSALIYFDKGLQNAIAVNDKVNHPKIQKQIAALYESTGKYDSSLYYARQAFINSERSAQSLEMLEISNLLVKLFRHSKNTDSAFFYQDISNTMTARLYGPQKFRELQTLMLNEQQREQKNIQQHQQFRNRIKYIILMSALGIFLLLAFILLRNNRHKQKANLLLEAQKNKIEHTLTELKAAQSQLIQSEKMASLGELTAGIAHEIQNPLNFVNNFSDVSTELVDEMNDAMAKGNASLAKQIAEDLKENLKKINHHGKRADAIVKGMLQHSNSSTGKKALTDINKLADEYLRLAYHGLRAKDKSFNAILKTDYDERMGSINIIPQDIGRVILNLITNAFYAVDEKRKNATANYEPTVTIKTLKIPASGGGEALISVTDNGDGIQEKVKDKIFQPFFTTKPAGQGTGLGLSLAYDIIKAHGGELKVETKEGEGAVFVITLPL